MKKKYFPTTHFKRRFKERMDRDLEVADILYIANKLNKRQYKVADINTANKHKGATYLINFKGQDIMIAIDRQQGRLVTIMPAD
jgi:hypothetical protein